MTRILTIIALLFGTPGWAGEAYFCSEDETVSIWSKNGNRHTIDTGRVEAFRIIISGDKSRVRGEPAKCEKRSSDTYQCNYFGGILSLNIKALRFIDARGFNAPIPMDGMIASAGFCDKI